VYAGLIEEAAICQALRCEFQAREPLLAHSQNLYFSLRWNKRSWSSHFLGLFHVPGPHLSAFQIRDDTPLTPGPHHLSAVRTVCGSGSSSWPACYLIAMNRSTWMLVKHWEDHQSCQRASGSLYQLLPPINSKARPIPHLQILNDLLRMTMIFFKLFY
jgi:hypothetical protein